MGLFNWFSKDEPVVAETKAITPYIDAILSNSGQDYAGVNVTYSAAMRQADVYTCIRIIAESIGQIPLCLYREDGTKVSRGNRWYKTFCEMPNDYMTRQEMIEYLVTVLLIRGQAFLDISKRNRLGDVMELIPLRYFDTVDLNMNTEGIPYARWVTNNGQSKTSYPPFHKDDLFDVKLQTLDGYRGISPIRTQAEQVGSGIAAMRHVAKVFENGARLSGVLSTDDVLTEESAQRISTSWNSAYGGTDNAGKVAVLEAGLAYTNVTMSNQDAQLLELLQFSRGQIAAMFKVPSHMLNDNSAATFNNVEQNNLQFLKHTLMPIITKLEANLNKLIPETMYLKFDTTQFTRGDIKTQAEVAEALIKSGIISHEESREMFDLSPQNEDDQFVIESNNYTWGKWSEIEELKAMQREQQAVALEGSKIANTNAGKEATDGTEEQTSSVSNEGSQ